MKPGQFYIERLGCAKNQVDAEIMRARLEDAGWSLTEDQRAASLIMVNTCAFIEPALQESIDATLGLLAEYPETPVAITGCMAQRYSNDLVSEIPELAGVFGNRDPAKIVDFVHALGTVDQPFVYVPEGGPGLPSTPRRHLFSAPGSAFVKIAEGCQHRCTFCAIPLIRGSLRMRTSDSVCDEVRQLATAGIREFNLVAQDLAAWRDDGDGTSGVTALVQKILDLPGEYWIRPLYLYPDTFPLDLVELSCKDPRLLPYFDLSVQHASGEILKRMGRPGSGEDYLRLIDSIRSINPDAVLRSSLIVGFPGETTSDHEKLISFLKTAELDWVGVFDFSPQEGTPAARLAEREGMPDAETVTERRRELESLQTEIMSVRLRRWVGRRMRLLVEETMEDFAITRSAINAPEVDGLVVLHTDGATPSPGSFVSAEITGVSGVDLQARLIT